MTQPIERSPPRGPIYPLVLSERPAEDPASPKGGSQVLPQRGRDPIEPLFPAVSLAERLAFGELPGIATAPRSRRGELLRAYSFVYLEEELRARRWSRTGRLSPASSSSPPRRRVR